MAWDSTPPVPVPVPSVQKASNRRIKKLHARAVRPGNIRTLRDKAHARTARRGNTTLTGEQVVPTGVGHVPKASTKAPRRSITAIGVQQGRNPSLETMPVQAVQTVTPGGTGELQKQTAIVVCFVLLVNTPALRQDVIPVAGTVPMANPPTVPEMAVLPVQRGDSLSPVKRLATVVTAAQLGVMPAARAG